MAFIGVIIGLILFLLQGCAYSYTINNYANAIYKAEGGLKTKHPYGIMVKYRHTTSRQACINTIKHRLSIYNRLRLKTGFTAFLGD